MEYAVDAVCQFLHALTHHFHPVESKVNDGLHVALVVPNAIHRLPPASMARQRRRVPARRLAFVVGISRVDSAGHGRMREVVGVRAASGRAPRARQVASARTLKSFRRQPVFFV